MTASGLLPLLRHLVADVERLLLAGSATAAADERLRQHRSALGPWLRHLFRSPGRYTPTFFRVVLPGYGRALRSEFRRCFTSDPDPGHHGRLFHTLCNLDPEAAPELCRVALRGGSPSLRVQALRR